MSENLVQILLPLALDEPFTYKDEIGVEIGDVVLVEFGKKRIWGLVVSRKSLVINQRIKSVLEKNPRVRFSKKQLEFLEKIASYNLASRGLVLRAFIGILNSNRIKKEPQALTQKISPEKFLLKKLSDAQRSCFDRLWTKICQRDLTPFLIDGVTGSGKTEIYFALIAKILAENPTAQLLILLPEIALTSQLLLRFEEQFGFKPAVWHSKITPKSRREIFYGAVEGEVRVLIGARSALLLPFKNLQLIVIDEEHDSSFKQEDVFNFHARDMAILLSHMEDFPVILASATPAIETYANAASDKYHHFILEQKFGAKNEIHLIDLRQERIERNEFLSQKLRHELVQNLVQKKQSLLFLNRRGYAPVTLCKTCGNKYECADCDFHLVLHKTKNQLVCHHCGHHERVTSECKFCGEQNSLIAVGAGVEKLVEEVKNFLPEARIALVTSDNVTNFSEVDELVTKILAREIDVIIGTQMITKGHDFPDLTLVGIVDADGLLYSSELRALEKSYQIFTQVIGRAGRRSKSGKVFIQTYNPQNFLLTQLLKNDKKSFYEFELQNRKSLTLPPFSRLARFEVSSFLESEARNFAKKLIQHFPASEQIELFGPAPAPIQRLKNRHHFLVNLKTERKTNLQKLILDVMKSLEIPSSIRVRIDVDPT
ncbi:MAG: primosomal protein N' [Alphaproteobacteria bacterium]|nr:primosomal protein N' [Alphaproteobacteria bacterium]